MSACDRPAAGRQARRSSPGSLLAAAVILAIAALLGHEHLAWAALDGSSILSSDAPRHFNAALNAWYLYHPSRPWVSFGSGYYPPGVAAASLLLFTIEGPSAEAFRHTQVLFTVLGSIGMGALAWRCGGRGAAIVASAAWLCFPEAFPRFQETQLDWPLAAGVSGALALLPVLRPSPRPSPRPALARAALGGLAMGVALLLKQSMLGFALPIGAVLIGRVLWLLATRSNRQATTAALELLVWSAAALLLCGRWYLLSRGHLQQGLEDTAAKHALPAGTDPLLWKTSLVAWYKRHGMLAPVAWAFGLGLLTLPWTARRRPILVPTIAAGLGGLLLFVSFPDPHERHFIALSAPVLAIATAPLGLLSGRSRRRQALASMLVLTGAGSALAWTLSWRLPTLPSTWQPLRAQGTGFGTTTPHGDGALLFAQLVARPGEWQRSAPPPGGLVWPLRETVATVLEVTDLPPRPPPPSPPPLLAICSPLLLAEGRGTLVDALQAELRASEEERIGVASTRTQPDLPGLLSQRQQRCGPDGHLFVAREVSARPEQITDDSPPLAAPGMQRLGLWPVLQGGQLSATVVLDGYLPGS